MFPPVDSHLTTAGRGLMAIPETLSMTGDNRAYSSGPTDSFAASHQVHNHLTGNLRGEVQPALVNYDHPVWDFGRFKQKFVNPSKMRLVKWHEIDAMMQ